MRLRRALICAAAVVVSAGCGSSGPAGSAHSATKSLAARSQAVGYQDDGHTVAAHAGTIVRVELESTYWTIDGSSNSRVLAAEGLVRRVGPARSRSCVPGAGCGSVSQSFVAVARGRAILSAHRTICGEAMACRPDQRNFAITVVVD